MDNFTRNELRKLIAGRHEACVSMYMGMHRKGRETRENQIRLKNCIGAAEDQFNEMGVKGTLRRTILEPARKAAEDNGFLQRQTDGLAVFAAPEEFRTYRVPLNFREQVFAGRRFRVRPLLPLLQGDGRFHVLAVSQNRVRLLRGTHFSVEELEPAALPRSLQDALQIDEYRESLQNMSYTSIGIGGPPSAGAAEGISHGHGGSSMDVKKSDEIREFFVRINHGLDEFFHEEQDPLVFAGVEYLFPIFRSVCHRRNLLSTPVTGNPDALDAETLHRKAWELVQPQFRASETEAMNRFGDGLAGDLVSSDLNEILAAATAGRVETLFFHPSREDWGLVNEETGEVTQRQPAEHAGAVDLVDRAVSQTLLTGGTVYALDGQSLPNDQTLGAIFRYASGEARAGR